MAKTNIQKVVEFMENSSPLNQAFVFQALESFSKQTVQNASQIRKEMEHSIVSPDAWIGCAQDWLDKHS